MHAKTRTLPFECSSNKPFLNYAMLTIKSEKYALKNLQLRLHFNSP